MGQQLNKMEEESAIDSADKQMEVIAMKSEECNQIINETSWNSTHNCPTIWDGLMCWPPGIPGEFSEKHCPSYVFGFDTEEYASRLCDENATWMNKTDFTQCFNKSQPTQLFVPTTHILNSTILKALVPTASTMALYGYGVSELALIIAFTILVAFKRLRCPRNMLHLHLFISFIMRASMRILKGNIFEQGMGLPSDFLLLNGTPIFHEHQEKNWKCKMVSVLLEYFTMANYSWILMEGLYIHNLVMFALFTDSSSIFVYIILGWGLPSVFIIHWALARAFTENNLCWTTHANVQNSFILKAPIAASILINFFLFVNIVRLILVKMKSSIQEEATRYWKWAKSTLVLVPLLGIHYTFTLLMGILNKNETVEIIWIFCDQFFASFQGFFVAVLYCFVNREVQEEIKLKWKRMTADSGRVIEQTMSYGSRSSSTSMKPPWSLVHLWQRFRSNRRKRTSRRSCRRTDTVDCIVCESCPIGHNHVALRHQYHSQEEAEMGLMNDGNLSI